MSPFAVAAIWLSISAAVSLMLGRYLRRRANAQSRIYHISRHPVDPEMIRRMWLNHNA